MGSLVISVPIGPPVHAMKYLNGVLKAMEGSAKPVVFSILGERSPLPQEFLDLAREKKLILSRLGRTVHARHWRRSRSTAAPWPARK